MFKRLAVTFSPGLCLLTPCAFCRLGGREERFSEKSNAGVRAPVEGSAVELRQDVDLADAGVDAIAHGHINQAVGAPNRHGRLGPGLCEGVQPGTRSSTQNDCCSTSPLSNWQSNIGPLSLCVRNLG